MNLFFENDPDEVGFEQSAYYYWYLYMQLVEDYGRSHPLWKDFGDVQRPFQDWWDERGDYLFFVEEPLAVDELKSNKDIQKARAEGAYIVRIDPDCSRDYLNFHFQIFLDEKGIRTKTGPRKHKEKSKRARYSIEHRPHIATLKTSLAAWKLRREHPELSLYEIGCKLNLCPNNIIDEHVVDLNATSKKNVMSSTVSRHLRRARNILKNVSIGVFPESK